MRILCPSTLCLVVAIALGLPGCGGPHLDFFGVSPTFVLSFRDLTTKVVPGAIEDDGDDKDVVIKGRAKFKPSKGSEVGLDRRMKLKSKVDGGEATVATEVEMTGNVTARLRVAVTELDDLVDGQTLGFLERRATGGGPVKRLEAVWTLAIDGFTVRALDNGEPAGLPLELPGTYEVVLAIQDQGADFVLLTGVPTGESITELDPVADLVTIAQEADTESAVFAFGAEGLGKKAIVWIGQFTLEFGADIAVGEAETDIGTLLVLAQQELEDAQALLDEDASGEAAVISMYNLLSGASSQLNEAWSLLLTALEQGTLQPSTQGVDAEKNVKGSLGWVFPASQDMFDAMQDGGTSIKKVKSHVKVGLKKCELAIAQIAGFKSNSHGKLEKTLDLTVE